MPTTVQIREAIDLYAAASNTKNADAYAALFTSDAVQVDPYPTAPNVGRDAIRDAIQQIFDGCKTIRFEITELHSVADRAAISFQSTVTLASDSIMHVQGIEIITVTDDGLISAADVYFGDDDITFE